MTQQDWQPIETAPDMKTVLLFAVTDIGDNGEIKNWKMATGSQNVRASAWEWDGRVLESYDIQPTHWMPLPAPPRWIGSRSREERKAS